MSENTTELQEAAEAFSSLIGDVPVGDAATEEATEEVLDEHLDDTVDEENDVELEADTAEDEVEDEPEDEAEELFTVKVGDDEVNVSLNELINGYSRQQDYTRKTQAIAEQRRAVQELEQQYAQQLQSVQQIAQRLQEQPDIPEPQIDWDRLYQEDPIGWVRERELARDRQDQRAHRARELEAVKQEQQRIHQQQFASEIQRQREILTEMIPEWSDPEVAKTEKAAIRKFAVDELGFTEEDVASAYDARIVSALRKSWQFSQGSKTAEKAIKPQRDKPVAKRGRSYKPESNRPSSAQKRFAKTGSMHDAADLFSEMFK
jgi:hypothetical protein